MTLSAPGVLFRRMLPAIAVLMLAISSQASAATNYFWKQTNSIWDNTTADWYTANTFPVPAISWVADSNANFNDTTAGTATLGANVSVNQLNFNGATNDVINAGAGPFKITFNGASPTLNVGTGTASFAATINANIADAPNGSNSLNIVDTTSGSGTISNLLTLGGTATFNSGSLTITSNANGKEHFAVGHSQAWTLTNLNLVGSVANISFIGGAFNGTGLTGAFPTVTQGSINFAGSNPTLTWGGSGANNLQANPSWALYDTLSSTSADPVHFVANTSLFTSGAVVTPAQPVLNIGVSADNIGGGLAGTSSNSFPHGLILDNSLPATGTGAWDSTKGYTWTARYNFNQPNAAGTGAGAGPIQVKANGLCITDVGSASTVQVTVANSIVLNSGNIAPASEAAGGLFLTAIGATKPGTVANSVPNTAMVYNGVITDPAGNGTGSGVGGVVIGNDLSRPSGGAGLTKFNAQMTYSGKTIFNGTYNTSTNSISVLQMGTTNALPANNILQFGYSDNLASTVLTTKPLGTVDLNGYSQTIASLVSSCDPGTAVNGITNTNSSPTGGQVAIPTLSITGSTNDWFTGGFGTTAASGAQYPNLATSTGNIAITRTGSGSTTLGASNSAGFSYGNRSNYVGDTNVTGTAKLIAGATDAFSPNSNFKLNSGSGTLDLNGYSNTVNSLSGSAAATITNNTNDVNYNVSYLDGKYGNAAVSSGVSAGTIITTSGPGATGQGEAMLTIGTGSTSSSTTATFSGVVKDGTSGTLGLSLAGLGTQILAGVNTYTGPTTVNAGTLRVAGSLASGSAVTVNAGGTLSGTGSVGGSVTVNASGNISAGTSTTPGTLTVGSLNLSNSSNYSWKITNATAVAGSGYDTLLSTGSLTLPSTSLNVNLNSLGAQATNFNPAASAHWTLGTFSSISGFSAGVFNVNASGFSGGQLLSTFTVTNPSGGVLQLNYNPGPTLTNLTWTPANGSSDWNDGSNNNWNNGSTNQNWNSARSATFAGTGSTVAINQATAAQALIFNSTGFVLSGSGPLSFSGISGYTALTVQTASGTATINVPITSPINVVGGGTLVLGSSANTFGGAATGITVNGGTLQGTVASLGASTNILNNTQVLFQETVNENYGGVMSGSGALVKQGAGVLTLSGTNLYTGGTTLRSGGAVKVTADSNLGDAGGSVTFDGGSLDLTGTSTSGFSLARALVVTANGGAYSDNGSGTNPIAFTGGALLSSGSTFTKNGAGIMQINSSPWRGSGTINVAAGSLLVGDETNANSDGHLLLGGNSLKFGNNTSLTVAGGSDTGASVTPPSMSIGAAASNAAFTLHVYKTGGNAGSGALNPSLNSALTLNVASAGTSSFTVDKSGDSNNGLIATSKVSLGSVTVPFVGTVTSGVLVASSVGTINFQTYASGSNFIGLQFNGNFSDGFNNVVFLGQGSSTQNPGFGVAFNSAGTQPSGNWTIGNAAGTNAEILQLSAANSTSPGNTITSGTVLINNFSQLKFTPKYGVYAPKSLTINGAGPNDPVIGDPTGALSLDSQAKVTLAAPVTINTNTVFDMTAGSAQQPTTLLLSGLVTQAAGQTLTLKANTVTSSDFATLEFAAANGAALASSTILNGGTLQVDLGSSMGTGSLALSQKRDHSTFVVLNNTTQAIGSLSSSYDGSNSTTTAPAQTITLNGTILSITQSTNSEFGTFVTDATPGGSISSIAGTGGITLASGSTAVLTLSDPNTFSGATTISNTSSSGGLTLANFNALQNSTVTPTVNSTGTSGGLQLDLTHSQSAPNQLAGSTNTSATYYFGGLSGGGNFTLAENVASSPRAINLVIGGNNANSTYSGVMSGAGAVTKSGNGTLIFTAADLYSGGTTITAGTLQLGDGTANNGSVVGSIVDNSALALAVKPTTSQTFANAISGTGTLSKTGTGTATLSGANSYTGTTTISQGTLAISADSKLGTVASPTAGQLMLNGGMLQATRASFALSSNRGLAVGSSGGTILTDPSVTLTVPGQPSLAGGSTLTIAANSSVIFKPLSNTAVVGRTLLCRWRRGRPSSWMGLTRP